VRLSQLFPHVLDVRCVSHRRCRATLELLARRAELSGEHGRPAFGSLELRGARLLRGRRDVTLPAPLEELPLMVRAGAILPLLPETVQTLASYGAGSTVGLDDVRNQLHLIAFPRGKSRSPFGENGGLRSRERKRSWKLTIRRAKRYRITLDASLTTLRRKLRPCAVRLDGRRLKRKKWSVRNGVLRVRFRTRREVSHLAVLDRARCRRHAPRR
jgi:hypothetical protein